MAAELPVLFHDILREAGELSLREKPKMQIEVKADGSLVTTVDRAVEKFLRDRLPGLLPGSDCYGEEFGPPENAEANSIWFIDPIDGTSNFVHGQPLWAITVGLVQDGKVTLGGVVMPEMERLYMAADGQGATLNGKSLTAPSVEQLGENDLVGVDVSDLGPLSKVLGYKMRHLGSCVLEMCFCTTGELKAMVSRGPRLYDMAGSLVICREAGLEVCFADGKPFREEGFTRGERVSPYIVQPQGSDLCRIVSQCFGDQ